MSTIAVNGLKIYYEIRGEGSPLVLLPGLLGTIGSHWGQFIPPLARHYRTIAVDLRGHGHTDNPAPSGKGVTGELHISQMANDLNGLLDTLGIERVSVLGYSLGGSVGLLAGLNRPGRIQSLVMHATKFFWDEASISAMLADLNPDTMLEKIPRYAGALQKEHSSIYGHDYWRVLLSAAARLVKASPEEAPTIKQAGETNYPVLVSVGDRDQLVRLDEANRLARLLPKGELLVLPATQHPLQRVRLGLFLPALLDFLERASKADIQRTGLTRNESKA